MRKERGKVFVASMVRAFLEGHKHQFRVPMKPQPPEGWMPWEPTDLPFSGQFYFVSSLEPAFSGSNRPLLQIEGRTVLIRSPYGVIGDGIYVKETWAQIYNQDGCLQEGTKHSYNCPCSGCHIEYRADTGASLPGEWPEELRDDLCCPKWRSSIHMLRWASRIQRDITRVRAQRLQDLTEGEANLERIAKEAYLTSEGYYLESIHGTWRGGYAAHWDSLYAEKELGWFLNPWVWAYDLEDRESKEITRV